MSKIALPRVGAIIDERGQKRIGDDLAEAGNGSRSESDAAHRGLRKGAGRRAQPRAGASPTKPGSKQARRSRRHAASALEAELNAHLADAGKADRRDQQAAMAQCPRHRRRRRSAPLSSA